MILLLNPNTSVETTSAMVEIAREAAPCLALAGRTAPFGPAMITTPEDLLASAGAVMALAAARPTVGAVRGYIIAAFGDPGLEMLRAKIRRPVVGIGEASFQEAASYGGFGIATTTTALEAAILARVAASGLPGFTGCRFTTGTAQALTARPEALVEALGLAVEACISDGARAVIIGGGPLARAARVLAPRFAVPIVEPVPAAARLMARRLAGDHPGTASGVGPPLDRDAPQP